MVNREVLFFLTEANCGVDVGQVSPDSALTDEFGNVTGCLSVPSPGSWGVRIKFRDEDRPEPCPDTGNSACDPTDPDPAKRCVEISSSNACKSIVAIPNVCPQLSLSMLDSVFVCKGDPVCILLAAIDGNSGDVITLSKLSGSGIYSPKSGLSPLNDTFCFVPDTSGFYTFIFRVTDGVCVDDDTVTVLVTINSAPVVYASGGTKFFCVPDTLKIPVCVSDQDYGDSVKLEKINSPGSFPTKINPAPFCDTLRFYVTSSGNYKFIFQATDECQGKDSVEVSWEVVIDGDSQVICNNNLLTFTAFSPVDLRVTDEFGGEISLNTNTIGSTATYDTTRDLNNDGETEDIINILKPLIGDYDIEVITEPETPETATYTLAVRINGNDQRSVVVNAIVPPPGEDTSFSYQVFAYIRGDMFGEDNKVTIGDLVFLLNYLFKNGPAPDPIILGDLDCNGVVGNTDLVLFINYLFKKGTPPCS